MKNREPPPSTVFALGTLAVLALLILACEAPPSTGDEPSPRTPEAAAAATPAEPSSGPYLRVLGTAQDGGLPHAACTCERCEAARHVPGRRRAVASLAVVLPAPEEVWLVDATPDVREQLDALEDLRRPVPGRVDRRPVDGVLLTHAHIGHYLGLAFFGFEAVSTSALPVVCTPRMARFLRQNGPWSQLVEKGNIDLRTVAPPGSYTLGDGVEVSLLQVPHRDEFSDTVAFLFRGPRSTVLYVPDTDAWDRWPTPLTEVLAGVDVALLDATFYSLDELPGRSISEVPHPLMGQTMDLLQERVDAGSLGVYFTHLNHSNPALDPHGEARREIERRGFFVLEDGQELPL